jgi:hypothetical protein
MEYETLDSQPPKKNKFNKIEQSYDSNIKEQVFNKDDFSTMLIDLFKKVNLKIAIFLFLLGIFIFSDIFIEMILSQFSGSVEGSETTTKGTIIQLIFISVSYIILDLLVQGEIL